MKNNSMMIMTEGNHRKQILLYALPIFVGYLFQQLYSTVDALIVGNILGSDALAAVTSTGSLTFLFIGFFTGFATGASVIIARLIGADNAGMCHKAVQTTLTFGVILGVVMTVLGLCTAGPLLRMMGTPDNVLPLADVYLSIWFAGSFGLIMYNMCVSVLQAGGDAKHPLYYLVCSSIVNVVLDLVLIGPMHMGVGGAAFATILSQFLSMILAFVRLTREKSMIHASIREWMLDGEILKETIRYGLPTGLQGTIIDFANVLIQSYINTFGAAAIAGLGAYTRIEGFGFLPITAFSNALTTYVSQNTGAGKQDRVEAGIRFGLVTALAIIETIGVLIFIFAPQLLSLFCQDLQVIAYGVLRARIVTLFFFLCGFSHICSAIARGVGKPVLPMVVMMICWCGVRVAVLMTIGQTVHDLRLVLWLYPITWSLSSVVFLLWMKNGGLA
ncbi:MAG: MATE family efflux transporter [Bulleidia sp.]